MGSSESALVVTVRNRVGHLAVNGSRVQMAAVAQQLHAQLQEWGESECVLAVVLRLRPLHPTDDEGLTEKSLTGAECELAARIAEYPKPILALLDGKLPGTTAWVQQATLRALTEGSTLEVVCPLPASSCAIPPLAFPLPAPLARYLDLIQRPLRPADALYVGLADYCLPREMVAEFDRCLDGMGWTTHPREALRTLLATVATRKMPGAELKALRLAIDEHFAFDSLDTICASLERESRPAYQDWADETLARLDSQRRQGPPKPLELLRQPREDAWGNVAEAADASRKL